MQYLYIPSLSDNQTILFWTETECFKLYTKHRVRRHIRMECKFPYSYCDLSLVCHAVFLGMEVNFTKSGLHLYWQREVIWDFIKFNQFLESTKTGTLPSPNKPKSCLASISTDNTIKMSIIILWILGEMMHNLICVVRGHLQNMFGITQKVLLITLDLFSFVEGLLFFYHTVSKVNKPYKYYR